MIVTGGWVSRGLPVGRMNEKMRARLAHDVTCRFTADCSLPSPGNLTGIKCHPGESDGLWTGIMATSEVLRYAVKQDSASAKIAGVRMAAMNVGAGTWLGLLLPHGI